ncbi:3-deoxy-manno-octulosonate cytidylyltransferase [Tenuifilum thalassicum]|uniref:3-deoxy-manno-octulosonate cytidylyltransferase n=1 Tax=Tenuifilum thalassicum TaxID=2590900 RepID=A0A7D4AYX5_9BACT|nr:3-deoxy-manno-octulosonate cytidylyltransferase [Tenuifilum thalassicum]QKG81094.1 3-deoxy-manno-octulosonate cytidylyltransferase [Tenuifilum thalassicum]
MKSIGIIPARYASTRFPGKPLAIIAGKPMIQWVYERASEVFEWCFVATDDDRIKKVVEGFGGKVVMTSEQHKSGTDRCSEALDIIQSSYNQKFDVVVNIQGDEPFIQPQQLGKLLDCFNDNQVQIATLVKAFSPDEDIFNPNSPKVIINSKRQAIYFSRSAIPFIRGKEKDEWQNSHKFFKHIGLYAYRDDVLKKITRLKQTPLELAESLEQLRWIENGFSITVAETDMETIAVDTPEDLERVKQQAIEILKDN